MKHDTNKQFPQSMYAVADIQLSFDNAPMLNRLQKRADALKSAKYEKAKEIQQEMTEYKNKHFDELTEPKYFFCTFHTEHAYTVA